MVARRACVGILTEEYPHCMALTLTSEAHERSLGYEMWPKALFCHWIALSFNQTSLDVLES